MTEDDPIDHELYLIAEELSKQGNSLLDIKMAGNTARLMALGIAVGSIIRSANELRQMRRFIELRHEDEAPPTPETTQ